jgi:hypothetical protein
MGGGFMAPRKSAVAKTASTRNSVANVSSPEKLARTNTKSSQTRANDYEERERHLREAVIVGVVPVSVGTAMQHSLPEVPDIKQYANALIAIEERITKTQHELLAAHWSFPGHVATGTELARATGLSGYRAINSHYGRLGKLLRDEMGYTASGQQSYIISLFEQPARDGDWRLHMHPQLADALKNLGWVKSTAIGENEQETESQ